jgi:hypothetical protein
VVGIVESGGSTFGIQAAGTPGISAVDIVKTVSNAELIPGIEAMIQLAALSWHERDSGICPKISAGLDNRQKEVWN